MTTALFDLGMQSGIEVLVNETADGELPYSSGSADNTFIQTARGFVAYPKMQHTGGFLWIVTGQVLFLGSANTIEVQCMIDAVGLSTVMTFLSPAAVPTLGAFTLEAWIYPVASIVANKEQQQALKGCVTFNDGTNHIGTVFSSGAMTADTTTPAGHTLGLQIRKQLATVNHFLTLHSQFCARIGGKSGS
jgi:hypothetical protein